ncbi:MAG: ankyrin repeat protein [Planctomycetaceae bacterium]|jgi:ankyrin repeat protein
MTYVLDRNLIYYGLALAVILSGCSRPFDVTAEYDNLRRIIGNRDAAGLAQFISSGGVNPRVEMGGGLWVHPIHVAAAGRSQWAIDELVSAGADVNAPDSEGNSPLYWAMIRGGGAEGEEILQVLLNHGADIDQKIARDGRTLLQAEASSGGQSSAQVLLESGANVNAINKYGQTALHLAIRGPGVLDSRILDVVKLLLRHGATVDIKDHHGVTPIDLAESRKMPELTETLKQVIAGGSSGPDVDDVP